MGFLRAGLKTEKGEESEDADEGCTHGEHGVRQEGKTGDHSHAEQPLHHNPAVPCKSPRPDNAVEDGRKHRDARDNEPSTERFDGKWYVDSSKPQGCAVVQAYDKQYSESTESNGCGDQV